MDWLQYFPKKYFNLDFLSVYVLPSRALNMSETTWFLFHKQNAQEVCLAFAFCSAFPLMLFPCSCCGRKYIFSLDT
jgi:hypothetical protein